MSEEFAGLTVEAARRQLAATLRGRGVETPDLDARLLTGAALGLNLTGLAVQAARALDATETARLSAFARRRIAGEPVARIVGVKEFWGLPLRLSAATLVPRPDTETVVETALALVGRGERAPPRRILDIGTGSGALVLALLSEWPQAWGLGTDIEADALATAADNARNLGLAPRAAFVRGDYAKALDGSFDLIVSNPPYIPHGDIETLAVEVSCHDPHRALDGGVDGLDAYRRLVPQAARLLTAGGMMLLEIGYDQDNAVRRIVAAADLDLAPTRRDLAGVKRVVVARKRHS